MVHVVSQPINKYTHYNFMQDTYTWVYLSHSCQHV